MKKHQGFTLIELVIVIVILGILSAVALPRFINITSDARSASVAGMAGGVRSAASLAKAQYMVNGNTTATAISMDGQTVDVVTGDGRPDATATGIGVALQSTDGFNVTHAAGVSTFQPTNGGSATCQVTYTEASGAVAVDVSNC